MADISVPSTEIESCQSKKKTTKQERSTKVPQMENSLSQIAPVCERAIRPVSKSLFVRVRTLSVHKKSFI